MAASTRRLGEEEVRARAAELDGWSVRGNALHRELAFPDFVSAFGFLARVALLAERANHHPDWSNSYGKVVIDLASHDVGGISERDFALAHEIDSALRDAQ